jgi:hypothetical protein
VGSARLALPRGEVALEGDAFDVAAAFVDAVGAQEAQAAARRALDSVGWREASRAG